MTGGATMAKAKKPAGKAKANPDLMVPRTLKVRQEYAGWLDRFAARERVTLASLFDRALASHAREVGFELPPERVP